MLTVLPERSKFNHEQDNLCADFVESAQPVTRANRQGQRIDERFICAG
jgi:hypothetical protein